MTPVVWLFKGLLGLTLLSVSWRVNRLLLAIPPGGRQEYFIGVLAPRLGFALLYWSVLTLLRRRHVAGPVLGALLLAYHAVEAGHAALGAAAPASAWTVTLAGALCLLFGAGAVLSAREVVRWTSSRNGLRTGE